MTNYDQDPVEPGWNHKPGDPDDTERWWTGAEWSDYTRLASTMTAGEADGSGPGQSVEGQSAQDGTGQWGAHDATVTGDKASGDQASGDQASGDQADDSTQDRSGDQAGEGTGEGSDPAQAEASQVASGSESGAGQTVTPDPAQASQSVGYNDSVDSGAAPPPPEGSPTPEYAATNAATAAPYDPNAGQYAGAPGQYDPNVAQYAGAAGQYDPNVAQYAGAPGQYDPNVAQYAGAAGQAGAQYDPTTGQYAPNPGQYDPNAVQYDPNTGQYIPMGAMPGAGANRANAAMAFVDRVFAVADDGESGWDLNLATLAWIPGAGVIAVIAYALSGSQMSRHARSHIAGAFNLAISASILAALATSIFAAADANIVVGALWALVLSGLLAGIVFLLSKRDADGVGPILYWVWFGGWVLAAILTVTLWEGFYAFPILFGIPMIIIVVVNAVRGRVGKGTNFFGYPAIPILSQH